jgi:hypothetical protein
MEINELPVYRGLGLALIFIFLTVIGLLLYIRQIEQNFPRD